MKNLGIVFMFLALAVGASAFNYQLTWDAEGNDNPRSKYFSRKLHVPSSSSGLTLGRGYDMKLKSQAMVKSDLTRAGVQYADKLSKAAGLYGQSARNFIIKNKLQNFVITHSSQQILFEISVSRKITTAKRIFTKSDVVKKYGRADWDTRKQPIRDLVVDLLYRGDYTPSSRSFLQKPIVQNDVKKLALLMSSRTLWSRVPYDRFKRRMDYMNKFRKLYEKRMLNELEIRDLVVDLLYRGDYTPSSRSFLQKPIVQNDMKKLANFAKLMSKRARWFRVPYDFSLKRRKNYMNKFQKLYEKNRKNK